MKEKAESNLKNYCPEAMIHLMVFALTAVGVLGFWGNTNAQETPCMLCDFETGENTNGPEGGGTGYFKCRENYDPLPVVSPGAVGTNYCIKDHSPSTSDNTFYIDNRSSRTLIEEAYGANRFKAWIKLPVGFTQAPDNNFHFGTYTRDPEIYSNVQGSHYYHYFNLPGSPYWTKIIANTHPTHHTGSKEDVPDNPTLSKGWNYYDGFTRFYFEIKSNCGMEGNWDWYIDEVEFYHEDEPENTVSINSVACSYFGEGHFQLNWRGEYCTWNNSHYEVRYSTSPITNANYLSAQIAPGCSNVAKISARGTYSWVKADFTIPITSGTAYFAIKDLDSDNPYVTRIDYPIFEEGENNNDTIAPIRSNPQPSGEQTSGTTQTTISLTTDETAVCKYSETAGTDYDSMENIFDNTNSTIHTQTITGLSDGETYTYYIRCQDEQGNTNTDDYPITFSVAETSLQGDVTGDNIVDINDVQACVNHILGTQNWGSAADVNGDGGVNVSDVQEIVNIVLG